MQCFDNNPDLIERKVRRRDDWTSADWVYVDIDSRNDKQTAFGFALNAGGTMMDIYFYNDGHSDDSWDAVWEGRTSIDDSGWTAEFRIPYTALRFPPAEEYTWGFNIGREICRKNEEIWWVVIPREDAGFVSKFGTISGMRNIPQPFNLEAVPYINNKYSNTSETDGFEYGAGLDLKYSLNSGLILDATINPDFGQVEADPAVLNLGVFETYYPEKRPFFVEGAAFFETPFQLFYSRRIGSQPGYYEFDDDEEIVDSPDNTTIISAAKMTGKTANGISIGIIEAVTAREYAVVEDGEGNERDGIMEPYTNFLVTRIMKDLWTGNSSVGFMATAKNREEGMSAYVGGVDWNLKLLDNNYELIGQLLASDRGENFDTRESGYGFNIEFGKEGGKHHFFNIDYTMKSPDFYINDMGYNRRSDQIFLNLDYWHKTMEPMGIFRRTWVGLEHWRGWNYDKNVLDNGVSFWVNLQYLNYYWTNFGAHYNFQRYDDLGTRGGPLIKPPDNMGYWVWCSTNQSRKVYTGINFWGGQNTSESWWGGAYWDLVVKPIDRLETSIGVHFDRMFDENQWVDNIEDESDSTHYVFGRLMQETAILTVRASYSFTRDISFQFYAEPFNGVGKFKEYIELAEPGTYKFKPYEVDENYDYNWKNLNLNAVFRWEFSPGSTIFIVWSRGMSDEEYPGDFNYRDNFNRLVYAEPDDIFMVKINKWFNY